MFRWITDSFDTIMYRRKRRALAAVDWRTLVSRLQPHVDSHSVFLETRYAGFVPVPTQTDSGVELDIVAVVVALVDEHTEAWDTEAPAREMAEKLASVVGRPLPVLISRDVRSPVSWYVRVAA